MMLLTRMLTTMQLGLPHGYIYIYIYIYIYTHDEKLKNQVIQIDKFIVNESQRYYVLVLINHHQDFRIDDNKYC